MIIQCDQCSARFRLDDNKVTESGVKVRCKRCQHIFLVRKDLPQEEPDLDALLMGLRPDTSRDQAIPAEEVPSPPAPEASEPSPEPFLPEGEPAPLFPADEPAGAVAPEEFPPAPQAAEEFSVPFAPPRTGGEPSDAPPSDDRWFSFGTESQESESPATGSFDTAFASSGTAPPEEAPAILSESADHSFSFADEPPPDATASVTVSPGPDVDEVSLQAGWEEFEVEASAISGEPEETTSAASPYDGNDVRPDETPELPAWDGHEGFEIDLPEPGGPPAEPVPEGEEGPELKPIPVQFAEPAEDEAFDFSGWSSDEPEKEPAASAPSYGPAEADEALPSSLLEERTFGFSTASDEALPVAPGSPGQTAWEPSSFVPAQDLSGQEPTEVQLPDTPDGHPPVLLDAGHDNKADTVRFDDVEPPFPVSSRRQGPSAVAIAGIGILALIVLAVGGGSALYLFKGPEALTKVGLGSVAGWLGLEKKASQRVLVRDITVSYLNNREGGELFVIRGEALNSFKTPRAAIQVRGLIYNAAGSIILQKTTFCGNPLTPEQLATLPMAKIEEAMNNRLGDSYANIGVPSGMTVPFVIVFSGLPKEAADYGVEVAGSQSAGQ